MRGNAGKRKRDAADMSASSSQRPTENTQKYRTICPAPDPASRKRKANQDMFQDTDSPSDESMRIEYAIVPGQSWADLNAYKKMKYLEADFQQGDYVYVNAMDYPPPPPPETASEEEILEYRKTMWVARIQEVKAVQANEVFVRVFWLYWPEELPNTGRAPYHGKQEMVLSNYTEIIEATTISGAAEVSFWNENDDTDAPLSELYYRSTINFAKSGKPVRSALRKHCKCRSEYNPDSTMYRCASSTCGIWNHETCLQKALLQEIDKQDRKSNLTTYLNERADAWKRERDDPQTIGKFLANGAEHVLQGARSIMHQIEGDENTVEMADEDFDAVGALSPSKTTKPHRPKSETLSGTATITSSQTPAHAARKRLSQDSRVKKGQVQISVKQEGAKNSVIAVVRFTPPSTTDAPVKPLQEWEFKLDCLRCHKPLD